MFSTKIESIIQPAVTDLNMFKPSAVESLNREELIKLYWQFHQRFKPFKVYSAYEANVLDTGSGNGGLFFWKKYMHPNRKDLKMTPSEKERQIIADLHP